MIKLIFGSVLESLAAIVGPIFGWLNKRVDADVQKHVVDTKAVSDISIAGLDGLSKADAVNGQIRMKEPTWGPAVLMMIAVLSPFVWHEWQVVLDSCRFVPGIVWAWDFIPFPWFAEHRIGSWGVAKLGAPDADGTSLWDKTEQAIFQSLFIGASTAVVAVAAIRAVKK